ncbi:MAG: ligase-associated DNA damage response exonuclease [Beijerinckiaceae bacterium]
MAESLLLTPTPAGLYCPAGDFFIDPVRATPRALITHGHSDHARAGHGAVMATRQTLDIMALRYGENFCGARQPAIYGETVDVNGVEVTFHPAGHVLGSAQICVCDGKTRIVVSGDYKREHDPTCAPFEPIRCDVFITEATFGLPVFRHPDSRREAGKLLSSLKLFPERAHLVGAYSLGKAQRMMALAREAGWDRPIWIHGALEKITDYYIREGVELGDVRKVTAADRPKVAGEMVVCPPGSIQDLWSRKFPDPVAAFASGWMRVRARARQRGVELPLIVSDHADWNDLCDTVRETQCSELWVTHGEPDALAHWASTIGLRARPLHLVGYGDEDEAGSGEAAA